MGAVLDQMAIAAEEIGGVHYIVNKIAFGLADEVTPVSAANPVPTTGLTDAQLRAAPLPVSIPGSMPVTGAFWQTTQPVSGSVSVSNFPASQAVTGTFFQATQPVSGPLTDAQLRASSFFTKPQSQSARVVRNFILNTFTAAPVADALQLVEQWYNNAAVAAATTPAVVPGGKALRLTGGRIETKSLATVGSVVMRVRVNVAGTVVIGSPIAATAACGTRAGATTVAMTGGHDHAEFTFGDGGLEIPAGAGVGFSLAGYGPTGALLLQGVTRFEVWGYEYTV